MNGARNAEVSDDLALDLGGLLRAIGRATRWLVPLVLGVLAVTLIGLQFVPSNYMGEARVLIESTDADFPGRTRGVEEERALLDTEGVASQVQLLMSADLARRVAKRLELASIPEFKAQGSGSILNDILVVFGLASDPGRSSPEERVLKHYYKNLDIYRLEGSRVIAVEYTSRDAELAAAVANTILDEYVALQSNAKRETTEVAASALEPQIAQLQKEVQSARKAVEDFRARADLLVGTDNTTLSQQQLAEISSEYSEAQATKAEAQAKADLIRQLLNSGGSLESATDVLESQLIQRLRERQVAIQSNIAELSITLLPNHPQLRALQSQLNDYNRQIRSEARKVLVGLENDAKVSSQQAKALETRLNELKMEAARSNADQVRLSELEREANAKAAQLDAVLSRFREADTRLRALALPADARIISRASVPIEPYSPKIGAITVVATLATFVLGCAFVVMREFLSGSALRRVAYETDSPPRQVAAAPAMHRPSGTGDGQPFGHSGPSAAFVPIQYGGYTSGAYNFSGIRAGRMADYVAGMAPERPGQSAHAAVHSETAVPGSAPLPDGADLAGCVAVLSVDDPIVSHEVAFDLVRSAAAAGKSALLVEVFPEQADDAAAPGFSDLVAGDAAFSQVIYQDGQSAAHLIEAGRVPISDPMAEDMRFHDALGAMARTHQLVVIDLGAIDGSKASANILGFADRVFVGAASGEHGQELVSAANLLARNTGAQVEVVSGGQMDGRPLAGSGWAA
ncbi:MAG: succinoglycan transporter [Roseibium sp.]|nr:succinoglycan transporter [Roseibium sp.]